MNDPLNKSDIAPAVARQAVAWLIEMQAGALSASRQIAWQQWLNGHAEHQRAWAHIQRVNQRLGGLSSPLAHATLGAPKSPGRRHAVKLLMVLGAGGTLAWNLRDEHVMQSMLADYSSRVGERRQVTLDDGSRLQLNTASAVDVRFDRQQRLIRLLQGEILLSSAADPRPLALLTGEGQVKAGTGASRFNLRQLEGHTHLALLEGTVQLQPATHAGPALVVQARQQVSFGPDAWDRVQALDAGSGAWSDGLLVASRMRLADFLQELGRYRHGRLKCDAQVAELLVSGSYPLADSERILDMLEVALPVKVQRLTRYWVTVQARA